MGRNKKYNEGAAERSAAQPYGGVKVSTGVWNKDKRAVAVIHVKSTRSKETLKQTTISHWLHSSAPRVGPVSPAAREPGVMHAGTSCVISR